MFKFQCHAGRGLQAPPRRGHLRLLPTAKRHGEAAEEGRGAVGGGERDREKAKRKMTLKNSVGSEFSVLLLIFMNKKWVYLTEVCHFKQER